MIKHVLAPVLPAAARPLLLPQRLIRAEGVVLTFDDGPHPEGTPAILEILARASARAMFFLIGEQVALRPQLAQRIAAAGHRVAVHGYRHRLQLRMNEAQLREDLSRAIATVQDATGESPRHHRPPYGIYAPAGLTAARAAKLQPLLWSRWGKDWRRFTTPERIAARSTREIAAGDVILLHDADFYSARDSHRRTAQALPRILETLKQRELDTVLPA